MCRKILRTAAIAALWLAVWAVAAAAVGQTLLLPSPLETCRALIAQLSQGSFWLAVGASLVRILSGFALGLVCGVLLALLTCRFAWWRAFFAPMLSIIKATPVASFIMLALVWIRTNGVPVFATFLIVLPVAWANLAAGIDSTDHDLLEMARAFRMTRFQTLRHIYLPSVMPALRATIASGMGMAWKAGVAAEVIATPRQSLGSHLYNAKIYLDTPALFATTAVVILLSLLLEKLVIYFARERRQRHAGSAVGHLPQAGK